MNSKKEKIFPIIYILICTLFSAWGFAPFAAVALSGLLCALFVKGGFKELCLHGALVIALFLAFGTSRGDTIIYGGIILCLSLTCALCITGKKSLSFTLTAASLAALAVISGVLVYFMKTQNNSAVNIIFGEYFAALGTLSSQQSDMAKQIADAVYSLSAMLDMLLPSILVLSCAAMAYITLSVSRLILKKSGITVLMRSFSELRLWGSFTFIFIILDLCLMFIPSNPVLSNVSIILTTLFTVCGVSVIDYFLKMKKVNAAIRTAIYAAGFLALSFMGVIGSLAFNILHFIGIIDSLRPLRPSNMSRKD